MHDAHNLYLETLAELGPAGLLLLALVFGVPLAAVRRARSSPLAAGACGAYVAYLVHAFIDWDWEMPAVTLAALFCGLSLLAAARPEGEPRALRSRVRLSSLGVTAGLIGLVLLGLLGNSAVSASSKSTEAAPLRAGGVTGQTRDVASRPGRASLGASSARRRLSQGSWRQRA